MDHNCLGDNDYDITNLLIAYDFFQEDSIDVMSSKEFYYSFSYF